MTEVDDLFQSALIAAMNADRIAGAFAPAYSAALMTLVSPRLSLSPGMRLSFCASERQGAHPKTIVTSLVADSGPTATLNGEKMWCTYGTEASVLLVIARSEDGTLKAVKADTFLPGIDIEQMNPTPFAPEIPHAKISLKDVVVAKSDILPGDGFSDYVKPFRTIEDIYVFTALCAYMAGKGRTRMWPRDVAEEAYCLIEAGRGLSKRDPKSSEVHIALAGLIAGARRIVKRCDELFEKEGDEEAMRWVRDRPLFDIANNVRAKRTEVAWHGEIGV